jgi:class 3 adenylate cyclase
LKQLVKSDLVWVILALCVLLAGMDFYSLGRNGQLSIELRSMVCMLILALSALLIGENFIVWEIMILFPNTVAVFLFSIKFGSFKHFFWALATEFILVLMMSLFQWRLHQSFMPDQAFVKMKNDYKDLKENGLARILNFSLLGCLRDRSKIISQAYHVLEVIFKADYSMIFMADYEKNQLVPLPRKGEIVSKKISPIMVNPDFWQKAAYDPEKGVMSVISGNNRLPSLREVIPQANLDALAVMPVSANNKVVGLMAIIRQKPENRPFLDPALFATFGYVLGSSLENCSMHEYRKKMLDSAEKQSETIRNAFGKYVSDSVVEQLMNNREIATLGGKKMKVSILMADLRGFTSLSTKMPIEKLVQILNTWFDKATNLILKSFGTIDKYMGDCIMVIFGAPIQKPDDVLRCVYTAFRLMEKFKEFREIIELPPGHELGLGVSISTGQAIVGNFGSSNRMEYTAIGETVNLASRLEKLAGPGEIVVDAVTFSELPQEKFRYDYRQNVEIKGLANQTVYRLHEVLRNPAG